LSDSDRPLVLYVDDDPVGREVFEAMLFEDGYRLEPAEDGGEALAKAKALVPDIILLDVMMPVLNGFEVLEHLRRDPVLADVPVLLVTALNDRESRLRGLEAGADDFVSKPIDRNELRARVRTVTRLGRFRRLQAERAKFEWAVEAADDGFLLLGAGDVVQYANPRARLLLQLAAAPDGLAGVRFREQAARHYNLEPEANWADWPADGKRMLVRPESKTLPALWLEAESFRLPLTEESRLVRLRDVTERVRSRREVWAFHSAINHKLRTPLAGMLPSLEFLATQPADAQGVAELASAALRGAERLQGELEDILSYVEASRRPSWTGESFDASALQTLVTDLAASRGIVGVSCAAEEASGVRLAIGREALELVLGELLDNARKFHPRREPAIEVRLACVDGEARLSVRDDGGSVAPEHLGEVWRPYYQSERHHTGQVEGMGLGLPMIASIVWTAGGQCRIANNGAGPGVTVEIRLPLA
jgi:CheY-like chemotaxis protein